MKKIIKINLLQKISDNYINYIKKLNQNKKSSNKRFYLIIKNNENNQIEKTEEMIIEELNDNFYKIKECLSRCGNIVLECNKEETKNILFSFFNLKIFLDK